MNLKIDIDKNSGFCFGVVYAIEMAEEILQNQDYLFCLGDIVHNDEEVRRLEKKGLKIIDHAQLQNLKNEKVLIRAHGEPPSTYKIALENDLELIDASCPVVLKLQNRIRTAYDKSEQIYIYGKHGHAEVLGLKGQTQNEAVVFQDLDELDLDKLPKKMTLFSQTTKSVHKFHELANTLTTRGIELTANDTICRQVSNRDEELRSFALRYDVIIFVSGTKSSNGKVLYNVCVEKNPNSYFVSNVDQLQKSWFMEAGKIGICGATSTPMWLMEEVRDKILTY
ncbi:MAG: 4-hydroxy-3-methylbut-2-enyl diphosphate reductase [Cyclobacteriaceae bacterium]|nr:4-hydroxy-3-methylbut-2-enyl diphosphate reductase [Cyclobacteriaceae bacterium]